MDVRKGLPNRTRDLQLAMSVAVNMGCGSVINLKISLIKTNGRWCGEKTFVSSVYRVVILLETVPDVSLSVEWLDATGITTHYCTLSSRSEPS